MDYLVILVSAILINNFVLAQFLGICPFLGVSARISSSISMGAAVTFVMTITAIVTWPLFYLVLEPYNLQFLQIISFILVIASLVQFVEMFIRKVSPPLYEALGIFLPLITTNCAIMGFALFAILKKYSYLQTIIYGVGAGIGFTLAILLMAGVREDLEFADVPKPLKGAGITLLVAGIMAMAFMGFAGLIR